MGHKIGRMSRTCWPYRYGFEVVKQDVIVHKSHRSPLGLGTIDAVVVSDDGRMLVSCNEDKCFVATELNTNTLLWSKKLCERYPTSDPHIYLGALWVNASLEPLEVWDLSTGLVIKQYAAIDDCSRSLGLAVFEGKLRQRHYRQ